MTNETIRPGDLVIVVRPRKCCPKSDDIGFIFSVKSIAKEIAHCPGCGQDEFEENALVGIDEFSCVAVERLKKLNPPAKQQTTEKEKEMA